MQDSQDKYEHSVVISIWLMTMILTNVIYFLMDSNPGLISLLMVVLGLPGIPLLKFFLRFLKINRTSAFVAIIASSIAVVVITILCAATGGLVFFFTDFFLVIDLVFVVSIIPSVAAVLSVLINGYYICDYINSDAINNPL